ncbi:MAG: sulfite exporter TauE/SafE family protein [Pseudomonadales bacterium]|nr:sulfite exporter TauE/SafE family protein [Pseudomonadales bacterium]
MDNFITSLASGFSLINWTIFLFGTLAVFTGALVQGSTGLGFGMISAPILMIINPVFVPGPLLVLAMIVSCLIAFREWKSIAWRGLSFALVGRIIGTILAGLTIAAIPLPAYGLIFGFMVLFAVVLSVIGWKVLPSIKNLVTAGFVSGYMGTLTSIGAPPIALAYQHETGPVVRSTLAMFFVIGAAISVITLAAVGNFAVGQLVISIIFLPALLIGFWVSSRLVPKIRGRLVRNSVLSLSALTSLALIIKSVAMMN